MHKLYSKKSLRTLAWLLSALMVMGTVPIRAAEPESTVPIEQGISDITITPNVGTDNTESENVEQTFELGTEQTGTDGAQQPAESSSDNVASEGDGVSRGVEEPSILLETDSEEKEKDDAGDEAGEVIEGKDEAEGELAETSEDEIVEEPEAVTETITTFEFVNQRVFPGQQMAAPEETEIEIEAPTEAGVQELAPVKLFASRFSQSAMTIEAAGEQLKAAMLNKETSVSIPVDIEVEVTSEDYETYKEFYSVEPTEAQMRIIKLAAMILRQASSHTGEPDEGDYLYFNFGRCSYSLDKDPEGNRCFGTLTMSDIQYLTDAEQEDYVRTAIEAIIEQNDLASKSDYEKIKFVYDWMHENCDYDNDHSGNDDYYPQFSAYSAFHDGKSVCQGYCNAAYYMLNKLGVDTRIVFGNDNSHTWLIVKLNGRYYNCDPTWDGYAADTSSYTYFLKGSGTFDNDHTRHADYLTERFCALHPISDSDYMESDVQILENDFTMAVGDEHQLEYSVEYDGEAPEITFTSSDETIAMIDENGLITALSYGDTTIRVAAGESYAECNVHVARKYDVSLAVKNNVTDKVEGEGKYAEGEVVSIEAIRETEDGFLFNKWDLPADLYILDEGKPTDYALSFYMPAYTMEIVAIYDEIKVTDVVLDKKEIAFEKIGDESKIVATITPENAHNKKVTFSSANENIAKVDENGIVTATGYGKTVITVKAGDVTATCDVSTKMPEHTITVTGMNSKGEEISQSRTVAMDEVVNLGISDLSQYGYRFVEWQITPSTVSLVKDTKKTDLKISIIVPNSDVTLKAVYEEIKPESITLGKDSVTLNIDETAKITATVLPENALNRMVAFASENSEVAKVDSEGTITAVKAGQTNVNVTSGDVKAVIKVVVKAKEPVSDVTTDGYIHINASSIKLYDGSTYQLKLTTENIDDVTYKSSNSSIAKIDEKGVITGVAEGTCTITALSQKANVSDDVEVTVVARTRSSSSSDSTSTSNRTNSSGSSSSGRGVSTRNSTSGTASTSNRTSSNNSNRNTNAATSTNNRTTASTTQQPANTTVSSANSGTLEGVRAYDSSAANAAREAANRYKAAADKVRADALRNGTFKSDGTADRKLATLIPQ